MPEVRTMKQLEEYLLKAIKDSLAKDVAKVVKDEEAEQVVKVVYDSYTSQEPYLPRRGQNDGLADTQNMISSVSQTGDISILEIKNITDGNPDADGTDLTESPDFLAGIIEKGRLPERKGKFTINRTDTQDEYLQARPFEEKTVESLKVSKRHVEAMKQGLKRHGLHVE